MSLPYEAAARGSHKFTLCANLREVGCYCPGVGTTNPFLEAALDCAKRGWRVFPVRPQAKEPLVKNWSTLATTDQKQIVNWWTQFSTANIGIATGKQSGLFVLDVDGGEGYASLRALETERGELPGTVTSKTGSGGLHFFFQYPAFDLRNSAGKLGPCLDVRGEGGYIIAAGSIHPNGRHYEWDSDGHPDDLGVAEAPPWLLNLSREAKVCKTADGASGEMGAILDGRRNETLASFAGLLRSRGLNLKGVRAALLGINEENCRPPLSQSEVERIAASIARYEPTPAQPSATWTPFPTDALPEPVRSYVERSSAAIGCDPSFVALPLLAALASAIGNACEIQLKPGWCEPAVLWAVVIGESGSLKSPALDAALRPIRRRQAKALREYQEKMDLHIGEMNEWKASASGRRRGTRGEAPKPPLCHRFYCGDTTVEALAHRLQSAPRGLLVARDELSGWLKSFNQYKRSGGGADAALWLEMHRAGSIIIDRKSGDTAVTSIPRAAISICGGIQPEILRKALGSEHFENGLAARLLMAMPPRCARKWSEAEIDAGSEERLETLFERLWALHPASIDDTASYCPCRIRLSTPAKSRWIDFYDEHGQTQAGLTGADAAAWAKLEGYAARLMLVIHCIRAVEDGFVEDGFVDVHSIEMAVRLTSWFRQETLRVYQELAALPEKRSEQMLIDFLRRRGGRTTARDVTRSCWKYRDDLEGAKAALDALARRGLGRWEEKPTGEAGGRPTTVFILGPTQRIDESTKPPILDETPPPNESEFGGQEGFVENGHLTEWT